MEKQEKTGLTDYAIVKFYKKVIRRFEQDIKNPYIDNNNVQHKLKHQAISLISEEQTNEIIRKHGINIFPKEEGQIDENIKENTIQQIVLLPKGKNGNNKKHYTYYSLYTHLRNSFAHDNIEKQDNCYVFKDYNDNGLTMNAKIKIRDFFKYIDTIYEESRKHANENKQQAKN